MGATKIKDRWVGRYRGKTDDTAKRIISSLDGRWKETESGLTGTDRGLLEGGREEEEEEEGVNRSKDCLAEREERTNRRWM